MLSAATLHARGLEHTHAGRYRSGRRDFLVALDRAPEPELHSRLLSSLANAEAMLGNFALASELANRASAVHGVDRHTAAVAISLQAFVSLLTGDIAMAKRRYETAIPDLTEGTTERANALFDHGVVLLQAHQFDAAAASFEGARSAFGRLHDDIGGAQAEHNLGYVRMRQGDLAGALILMERARVVLDPTSRTTAAINAQDKAEVMLAAGMADQAARILISVSRAFGARRLRRQQGECEFVAARALLHLDPVAARLQARQSAKRLRRQGVEPWALRADTVAAVAEVLSGQTARGWLERSEVLAGRLRRRSLDHEAQLLDLYAARIAVRMGDFGDAANRLRRGRTNTRDSLTERLLERQSKAELAVARGRRRSALTHLRTGLDLLHDWQSSFGSLDLMSSVVGHGRELATTGIQLALEIGTPELVFEWSERARALTTRVVPVRPPKDEEAAADLVEIRTLTVTEPAAGTREARRLAELRERVRQRAWLGAGSGEVNRIAELDEIVEALGQDTALVSYLWDGRDRVHALVVTDADREVIDLGPSEPLSRLLGGLRADLDVSASELGEAMARVVRAGRDRRLAEVAEVLVAPLLPSIGDRRVVLTQAGILAGVPWSMLPGLVGRPVTVASAATRWLETRDLPAPKGTGFVAGPHVPRAVEEVKQSASRWPTSTVLLDGDATAESVLGLAGRVDVLHLSAHGRHAAENPLFSGVLLADGPLFGYDLDQLTEVPDVVILSACEVGRSTQRWAEESIGMVNAWLHAGARCVIASAAAVADDEACEVLQDVHRLMAAGTPPGVALAEATADRPTSFVCFGAGW